MFSAQTKESANNTKDFAANDIKNAAKNMNRDVHNTTDNVVDNLSDYANQAGRKVRGLVNSASDGLENATDTVCNEIKSHPVRSSLIALGAGFILGALLRR